ncbi:hypothetical protein Taro_028858, partial [Colocasia esculenta]|nr:hypothetical protein [Colocasia esculenta]
ETPTVGYYKATEQNNATSRPPTKVVTHTRLPQKPTESGTKRKQSSAHPPRPRNNQHNNSRNEHRTVLGETLTKTTTNGSGKSHQNTGQPSDAPQPRGQHNNNQKRAQH